MTPAQRASYKKALLELRRQLSQKGPVKLEPNRTADNKVGDDQDEQPLNEMMQSIASARNRNMEGVLKRVERALVKLDETPDDYGNCEDCEEPISKGRLDAMPYAELCVKCQGKNDGPKGGHTRKKLTDFI
ncbi:MAG: TraR/DksA family transcriptional regulator [Myxococcaceae bacterium]